MKVFRFDENKYGRELLLDLGKFEETDHFFFKPEPHAADFYELFFFDQAEGFFLLDNQLIELEDRLIIFASPYQRRAWEVERHKIKGHFLIFARQYMELLFADPLFVYRLQYFHQSKHPTYLQENDRTHAYHRHAFQNMRYELDNMNNDSEDFLRAFLLLILAGNNRDYCQKYGLLPEKMRFTNAFQFKKLVEHNIRTYPKVEDYAGMMNINRTTLNKQVKAQFGMTAKEFLKKRLIVEIKRELLYTDKTIAEIAWELNFSEPSSLTRMFSKLENRSPNEFRAAHQNVKAFIKG
ncbi:MAG: AraC family transcriptional regulator [Bacteroidota bacterium]